jgi:hypothetical protein
MGLDAVLRNPTNPDEYERLWGNECGSVLRVVGHMNHYNLYDTGGKTLKEVKFDLLRHIGTMITQLDTFDYEPTKSRHDHRWANGITLQSDLEVMAQLVGELNKVDVPDTWIVEWDY